MGFFIKSISMDLLILSFMTGLLAWFIAWLFVKFLFWPKNNGLLKLMATVDISEFINKESGGKQFEAILPTIDQQLNAFFTHTLGAKLPMVAMFIGEKTIVQLKEVFVEELREIFPGLVQQMALNTKKDFTENIASKWGPMIASKILKATRRYRIMAFAIGMVWGILLFILIHHV
jgi:hypothetical protein